MASSSASPDLSGSSFRKSITFGRVMRSLAISSLVIGFLSGLLLSDILFFSFAARAIPAVPRNRQAILPIFLTRVLHCQGASRRASDRLPFEDRGLMNNPYPQV